MGKIVQRERKSQSTVDLTVRLHGWPSEVRRLTVVEACWMITLEFRKSVSTSVKTHTVFSSESYDEALVKYEAFKTITE